jgi:hypothetical protein
MKREDPTCLSVTPIRTERGIFPASRLSRMRDQRLSSLRAVPLEPAIVPLTARIWTIYHTLFLSLDLPYSSANKIAASKTIYPLSR